MLVWEGTDRGGSVQPREVRRGALRGREGARVSEGSAALCTLAPTRKGHGDTPQLMNQSRNSAVSSVGARWRRFGEN